LQDEETAEDYIVASSTEADLDAVMAIERLSFPVPWEKAAFADELARPWARLEILRHEEGGRVLAFCNYWLVADELHILNIAVHPDERRHGCAARLLRHILDEARQGKARVISLEVRISNHAAAALYRKFGFREVGVRPKYYANNSEDALLMDLELPA
jgi:[ribosomal protein S18]-alanine N-acetyltransferase